LNAFPAIVGLLVSARRKKGGATPSREQPSLMRRLRAALPEPPAGAASLDRRTTTVFLVAIILLVVFQYFGKPESYRGVFAARLQPVADAWLGSHADMAPFAHWGLSSIVLRVLIRLR
jgi:hypothetical protein